MTRTRIQPARSAYPWPLWTDGRWHCAHLGSEYHVPTASFVSALHHHARRHGLDLRVIRHGDRSGATFRLRSRPTHEKPLVGEVSTYVTRLLGDLESFIGEQCECESGTGKKWRVAKTELREAFGAYAPHLAPVPPVEFGRAMGILYPQHQHTQPRVDGKRVTAYGGLRLLSSRHA